MTSRRTYRLPWKRVLVVWLMLTAVAVCTERLTAASDKEFEVGGWATDPALSFDPFSLTVLVDDPPAPAAKSAPKAPSAPAVGSGGGNPLGAGAGVRIPYRPVVRSPFRPGA